MTGVSAPESRLAPHCKVLLLAPSLDSIGGVQIYSRSLHAALEEVLGSARVRLVTVAGEPVSRKGRPALRASVKLRFAASGLAAAVSWSPDLILCTHLGVAPAAWLIYALIGTPYWLILHGIEIWSDVSFAKHNALEAAQCLVANSRFTLTAALERHGLHPARALILPPALPDRRSAGAADPPVLPPAALPPADSGCPVVLTVGRLAAAERYKGHDVMLDAWPAVLAGVPRAEYWIVGGGDDLPRLQARAAELGLSPSVRFLGPLAPAELGFCYDRCAIFAMPARTELDPASPRGEGFGIVFLEAMSHGKPVIGPRTGAPAEYIHSGDHGLLVDPDDPADVARAIIELLKNPQRALRMGEAGRQWAVSEFSFAKLCDRLRRALPS